MANGVKRMMQDNVTKYRRSIAISYVFMFLALFTVISGAFSYWYARKVAQIDHAEVWRYSASTLGHAQYCDL